MIWQEVCEHPSLKEIPFKIELNTQGQIVMSPVKVYHSIFQGKLSGLLYFNLTNGEALVECAIKTDDGTKVADVAWASEERLGIIENEAECSIAPEICIEVMSDSNTEKEMKDKIAALYLKVGAKEVWICDEYGSITFYNSQGKLSNSVLAPNFPAQL
ncbi:MAG: Uma2 family endonuclease [Gammaproteobacteria bacterium]|nr:Uma2 family endonuclease [Gammaproteobacteria bacterium]